MALYFTDGPEADARATLALLSPLDVEESARVGG